MCTYQTTCQKRLGQDRADVHFGSIKDTHIQTQTHRHTDTHIQTQTNGYTQTNRHTDTHAHTDTDIHTHTHTDTQTQTNRYTRTHIDTHRHKTTVYAVLLLASAVASSVGSTLHMLVAGRVMAGLGASGANDCLVEVALHAFISSPCSLRLHTHHQCLP